MLPSLRVFSYPVHDVEKLRFVFIHGLFDDGGRIRDAKRAEIFDEHRFPFLLGNTINFRYRGVFALIGVMAGILSYARLASWVVNTTTGLAKKAIMTLSMEIIKQFTHAQRRISGGDDIVLPAGHLEEAIIIDTSSIIDGRVLDVAKTGFLYGTILVPKFVLTELQQVADSQDSIKRSRGRRGFDIVNQLKKIKGIKIKILGESLPVGETVDEKLVSLARTFRAKLLTCDFNLNRMARLRSVVILNLNELSNALKTLPIPGEKLIVKIVHLGKDKNQGVGYLADGTRVVVKDGAENAGKEIEVEVTKILQVPSGRMIFARWL